MEASPRDASIEYHNNCFYQEIRENNHICIGWKLRFFSKALAICMILGCSLIHLHLENIYSKPQMIIRSSLSS